MELQVTRAYYFLSLTPYCCSVSRLFLRKPGLYLSFAGQEGKVDLFQRLHHLCQARTTQLTEQGLRAGWGGQEGLSDQSHPHTPCPSPLHPLTHCQ
jgi:hypothetical protein